MQPRLVHGPDAQEEGVRAVQRDPRQPHRGGQEVHLELYPSGSRGETPVEYSGKKPLQINFLENLEATFGYLICFMHDF